MCGAFAPQGNYITERAGYNGTICLANRATLPAVQLLAERLEF
jgi:hypothetical protein